MKVLFRRIHLYLSLAAGLIIMMSCFTGAIMVFEDELEHMFNPGRYYVTVGQKALPPEALVQQIKKMYPGATLVSLKQYTAADRSMEAGLISAKGRKPSGEVKAGAAKKEGGARPDLTVYIDPYTGKITGSFNKRTSFFFQVEMLHRWLLTGNNGFGKRIVGLSAFFFFFILVTGIILWWPRNRNILRQRLRIRKDASWKRLNHDLHIVTGFYTSIFLIITVSTGLIMSYNWINKGIFAFTGSSMENPEPPTSQIPEVRSDAPGLNEIYAGIKKNYSRAESYMIRLPNRPDGVYSVNVTPDADKETMFDTYYLDQYTGKLAGSRLASQKNTGQLIRAYVKPVHTGQIFGLPSKILSFIICLVTLTFPVTGLLMWINRLKAKRKSQGATVISPAKTRIFED